MQLLSENQEIDKLLFFLIMLYILRPMHCFLMGFVQLFNILSIFNRILNHKFVKAVKTQAHTHIHIHLHTQREVCMYTEHMHTMHTHIHDCIHVGAVEC